MARMNSTTASTAGRTILMTKLDHLCGSNFSIKRLLVSNVPPLRNDPVWIRSGEAVLWPYPECSHKLPPVYQGHVHPGTTSVGVMYSVEIAAGDSEKFPALRDSEQSFLCLWRVLFVERFKPIQPLGPQPSQRLLESGYGADARQRVG